MKTCAVPTCPLHIQREMLMCAPHWRRVPNILKKEVYIEASKYRRVDVHGEDFWPVRNRYYTVVKKAVYSVIGKGKNGN